MFITSIFEKAGKYIHNTGGGDFYNKYFSLLYLCIAFIMIFTQPFSF
jgi:hypothetical protein